MRGTNLGSMSEKRLNITKQVIGEAMVGQLVLSETLFYTLVDIINLSSNEAEAIAKKCFAGGTKLNAKEISVITQNISDRGYGLSSKQSTIFMKRHFMKNPRVEIVEESPLVWQMNGFKRFEEPCISGYDKYSLSSLIEEKGILEKKLKKVNNKIKTFPDDLSNLLKQRNALDNRYDNVRNQITKFLKS